MYKFIHNNINKYSKLPTFFFYLILFSTTPINATDFEAGKDAYHDRKYEKAIEILKPLAKEGNTQAEYYLDLIHKLGYGQATYEDGREAYLKNDFKSAYKILKPLADGGDSWSQYILSLMYESGQGVEKNQEESVKWLILAAESGVPKIQYDLGIRYFYGYGIEQNYIEAAKWWELSANAGLTDSQYNLGLMYYRGIGIEKDKQKAKLLIKNAAEKEHDKAQHRLAMIYALDDDDFMEGLKWLKKSAKHNNVEAQYNLGVFFEKGYGVTEDLDKAKEWYKLAADQGLEIAIEKIQSIEKIQLIDKENNELSPIDEKITNNQTKNISDQQVILETVQDSLNLTAWLRSQPADKYVLQLASVIKKEDIINFIKKRKFDEKAGYIEVTVNGITRYAAIYGLYNSYESAEKSKSNLPSNIGKSSWIRKIGVVKEILN